MGSGKMIGEEEICRNSKCLYTVECSSTFARVLMIKKEVIQQ
jgi:hypothetical protein